jgi:hypothetical protein
MSQHQQQYQRPLPRDPSSVTNILVSKQTREILRQLGTKRQTYDEIIQTILENSTFKNKLLDPLL